jgi:hypothetical protein
VTITRRRTPALAAAIGAFGVLAALGTAVAACAVRDANAGADGGPLADIVRPDVDPGPKGIVVTASGEDLAIVGYPWSPGVTSGGDPPAFVDGWAVRFEHVLVTIADVWLASDPDTDPANPIITGPIVARDPGPWAVDLSRGGPLLGKSGSPDEKTVALTAFRGDALDTTRRYAFGYSFVAASNDAKHVNLDDAGAKLYEQAKANHWAMLFVGTATYSAGAPPGGTPFAKMPPVVRFTIGLANPSRYVNCRNTDLMQIGGDYPRGLQPSPTRSTTAQITLHTDHLFWDALNVEGTPLHFDPIAAVASTYGAPDAGEGQATSSALVPLDVTGFKTATNDNLPWRTTVSDWEAPAGQMHFEANGTALRPRNAFLSFLAHAAASGGHMNADGQCVVKNEF